MNEVARRRDVLRHVARDVVLPHHRQPVRIGIGERPEEQRVDDAEDGGVGADAERERGNGDEGESRRADQEARRVAEVLDEVSHSSLQTSSNVKCRTPNAENSVLFGICHLPFGIALLPSDRASAHADCLRTPASGSFRLFVRAVTARVSRSRRAPRRPACAHRRRSRPTRRSVRRRRGDRRSRRAPTRLARGRRHRCP